MARSKLVSTLRTVSALLVVLGLVCVAVGVYSEATYDCDSGTFHDAQQVDRGEVEGEPTPFADLPPTEREFFLAALNDSVESDNSSPPGDLADRVVEYGGDHYRLVSYHADCAGNWMLAFAFVGTPLAVLGLLGLASTWLVRRRRPD